MGENLVLQSFVKEKEADLVELEARYRKDLGRIQELVGKLQVVEGEEADKQTAHADSREDANSNFCYCCSSQDHVWNNCFVHPGMVGGG